VASLLLKKRLKEEHIVIERNMPTNYQNGKIYRIVCNITGLTYIGSTCQTLSQRLTKHRGCYRQLLANPDKKKLVTSVKVIAGGDYDIVLLEKCPCESKEELHKRERYYIESMDCVNKNIPSRTDAEYRKVYYEENKETIAEYSKVYRDANKESIAERMKVYRDANKEAIAESDKVYRDANKEAIAEKNKVIVECGCGSTHRHRDKARHFKSKKHQLWAETQ
jgi:hypothetical protein